MPCGWLACAVITRSLPRSAWTSLQPCVGRWTCCAALAACHDAADLGALLSTFAEARVDYVAIGGFAIVLHGRNLSVSTRHGDFDVVRMPDIESLRLLEDEDA
jgi:hypothetical protein